MARTYKSKNIQTKKELSGAKNMTAEFEDKNKDIEDGLLTDIIPILKTGLKRKRLPNWSEEDLMESVLEYFGYCSEKDLKPSKSGLRLYLGVSRSQYHAWQSEPVKYGVISDIINMANDTMEIQYINRSEKFPTSNIFLLKSSHGHIDSSKVEVTTTNTITSSEINEVVNKLGLDK